MFAEENLQRIVDYIASGERPKNHGTVRTTIGVEVEHFVVTNDEKHDPIAYEPHDGRIGVVQVLEYLRAFYPEATYGIDGDIIGLAGEDGTVTLEPAAQLEMSVAPMSRVDGVKAAYERFRAHVDPFLADHGIRLYEAGYHPTRRALELELIPKQRYRYMNDFFAHIKTHGERMMRASASTQVSVDYQNETDAVRKMRIFSALAPILAAITDNTSVFEGEKNHSPIRRLLLWRDVDPARCQVVPGVFEADFGYRAYADWLLRTSPIFVTRAAANDPNGPTMRPVYNESAYDAYGDAPMTEEDIEHLISMFWPDVRLKKFVEVRPADCMRADDVYGYAALIKGIAYSETSLARIEDALGVSNGVWPLDEDDVAHAIDNIRGAGLTADVYGTPLATWEELLFGVAHDALDSDEAAYLDALEKFAHEKPWWSK